MKSEEIVLRVHILQKNVFANMSVKLQIYNNFIDVQTKFSFRDSLFCIVRMNTISYLVYILLDEFSSCFIQFAY